MAKKRNEKKTLEVGKDLTGDAILGDGNTIHKPVTQNIFISINHSSDIENIEAPDEKRLSAKQITADSDYKYSIKQNIESIVFNSALLAEKMYPRIVTREIESQLREIDDRLGHVDYNDPFNNAEYARQRIDEFNNVTGFEFETHDIKLVDFFLIHPEQIPVWLVFEEVYKDGSPNEWQTYRFYLESVYLGQGSRVSENLEKQINDWMQNKAERIYEIVKKNFPDISPKMHSIKPLEF